MMKNMFGTILSLMMLSCALTSCKQDSPVTVPTQQQEEAKAVEPGTFARGADVSWLTQMESEGMTFTNKAGVTTECMKLLKEETTEEGLLEAMKKEYDAAEDVLRRDVGRALSELRKIGAIDE